MGYPSTAQRRPVRVKPTPTNGEANRDSNALRASVLDAALALGFGTNKTVENWMFNTVAEEDEEAEDEVRVNQSYTLRSKTNKGYYRSPTLQV